VHHLIPKQHTRRKNLDPGPTIDICPACHRQIHAMFSNQQLAQELNSLEKLRQHPDMTRFLTWVKKQTVNQRVKVKRRQT